MNSTAGGGSVVVGGAAPGSSVWIILQVSQLLPLLLLLPKMHVENKFEVISEIIRELRGEVNCLARDRVSPRYQL